MTGGGSHERVVEANREARRRDPVDGEEEVHWLEALYVEIKIYAAHLVKNHVSDRISTLNLCGKTNQQFRSGRGRRGCERTLSIAEVSFENVRVILRHESVCSFCIPKLKLPFRTGVEFGAACVGDDPVFFHLQVAETDLVHNLWDDFLCALWRDEILEVPPISAAEDGMGPKGEGDEGVKEGNENGQPVVEDNYEEGEKAEATVVATLEGE